MTRSCSALAPLFLLTLLLGCSSKATGTGPVTGSDGGSSSAGSSGSSGTTSSSAAKACEDTATAIGRAAERCGEDFEASRKQFITEVAGGDCSNIVQVRDETSLRKTCFAWFVKASCAVLSEGPIDPSCSGQLLRPE